MRWFTGLCLLFALSAHGQVIYKCGQVYTDKPCKGGQELDIYPTDGMHSLSGTKRQSHEAVMREISRSFDAGFQRSVEEVRRINQCEALMRERQRIDAMSSLSAQAQERRFEIRKSQHALQCKDT